MTRLLTLGFILLFFFGNAQDNKDAVFPEDFFGVYVGTLHMSSSNESKQIPMEFHLLPTEENEVYTYQLVYGTGEGKQVRHYVLKVKDKEHGVYEVDEQNGIRLENRVVDNKMYTLFEVQGSLLTTFITFESDHLLFEIIFSDITKKQTSGGQEKDIPEVFSYPISVVQKARLIKQ